MFFKDDGDFVDDDGDDDGDVVVDDGHGDDGNDAIDDYDYGVHDNDDDDVDDYCKNVRLEWLSSLFWKCQENNLTAFRFPY